MFTHEIMAYGSHTPFSQGYAEDLELDMFFQPDSNKNGQVESFVHSFKRALLKEKQKRKVKVLDCSLLVYRIVSNPSTPTKCF